MSADNIIYIQCIKGDWWVWMGFASDEDKPKPGESDVHFRSYDEAFANACGWMRGEDIVEYEISCLPFK